MLSFGIMKTVNRRRVIKLTHWFIVSTFILLTLIALLTGCGKRGSLNVINPPTVYITSYEGVESDTLIADPYYFQRRIYWRGESQGGVVEGYAYRVLDLDNQPVHIPQKYIDEEGWIYHYKPGADQSIPLTDPEVRTIWTTKVYDVINFPATDGTYIPEEYYDEDEDEYKLLPSLVSIFEIKCIDNYEQESQINRRFFNVTSDVPDIEVMFADRFNPIALAEQETDTQIERYRTVGLGFDVEFHFTENTPYTTNIPQYFMFRIEKRNIQTGELISQVPLPGEGDNGWFTTRGQRNVSRIWLALEDDDPADFIGRDDVFFALNPDQFTNPNDYTSTPITETLMIMKAVNMSNVHSRERTAKFRVYENFRPQAIVYRRRTNVLGSNHFTTFQDASILRPLPEVETPEGTQLGMPFFVNSDLNFTALHSDDIRIYLSWGWRGQFEDNDPDKGFINEVHHQGTNTDYLASVKAFDIRLDGAPYYYPPLWDHPEFETRYKYVDEDGTEWLRVPRFYDIDTRALLTNVAPGDHLFEVRVLDSQNRTSQIEELNFVIQERIPRDQKSGILIIDNESFPIIDANINSFYQHLVSDYSGTVDFMNRRVIREATQSLNLFPAQRNIIAPPDIEPYRFIIWHCDNPTEIGPNSSNFHDDFDTINLYMRNGGNILISAGQNLKIMHEQALYGQGFINFNFERYFGIPYEEVDAIRRLGNQYNVNPYFVGATPDSNASLPLPALDFVPEFNPFVVGFGFEGLGPVAYFDFNIIEDTNVKTIYRMVVSDVEAALPFANQPVAIRRSTSQNTTYMFGFPLSHMDQDQAKAMMNVIINDLGL
ncbi:MAG: hypothetical protein K0B81_02715 [Candidatus Cloacimonetes bacterium]|nr:hypothetical protein [Candidatus Cloacimonadota bacterium]